MKKIAFISGASSGFGEACARQFAGAGYGLVLVARREARLAALADELSKQVPVHWAQVDVRDRSALTECVANLPEAFSAIDVLINNAGLALGTEPAQEADASDWEVMVDTNIKGLMWLTHAVLPGMVARNRGHIINLGSTAGSWPYPGGNAYCGTKAFVEQFTRGLRADLIGTRVRVGCISPGMAETEFSQVRMKGDEAKANAVYAGTEPLTADDIAGIALWMASCPPHVNVNALEVMPVCQAWGPLAVDRQ